ncbi:MAG: O-antigen ligase family protein [Bacteroidota bacterium]
MDILQRVIVFSIFIMGAFFVSGVGVDYMLGRLRIFESNPNTIGVWSSIVIVMTVDLIIKERKRKLELLYYLSAIAIAFFFVVISGSRKSLIMLAVGVFTYYIFLKRSLSSKLVLLIPFTLVIIIAYMYTMSSEIFMQRLTTELQRQDLGGRIPIWEAAYSIIRTSPYFGVGVGEFAYQTELYLGRVRDTHNEFIQITAYSGIIGLSCFLFFLSAIAKKIIYMLMNHRRISSSLPVALFVMLIIYLLSAGGGLTSFLYWFLVAYILAKSNPEVIEDSQD